MKIDILNTDSEHPINPYLERFKSQLEPYHSISILRSVDDLNGGEILFLISCSQKIDHDNLNLYSRRIVLHASDLPKGRGWSPHIWDLISGASAITLSAIDAAEDIDTGDIYFKRRIVIPKSLLWDEINDLLFSAELDMMKIFIEDHLSLTPVSQDQNVTPTYHRKRTPEDSVLDPNKSLIDQFDKIRVCDPNRFPAYFELNGSKYKLILERMDDD